MASETSRLGRIFQEPSLSVRLEMSCSSPEHLGAGISILLAFLLRPRYPSLKVYAFATPAGLLSRELARITEEFVFTVGVGDDFVMRLSNLRTSLLRVLHACRLPKKQNKEEKKFEMRWAQPEEFTELLVMPRMLLDHLPENIDEAITTLLEQQKELPQYVL
ncbi:Sn1-specific diacylglycerol lipase alpha [Melipona quadrifasciata]|uniref:Sn1-specific diacylglycerol lipase alpha n=1 Tax=Melipona quadrifasciata TaxID=166423 RepID=A0A0M8ZN11_9HYME|nr:Sn1-specific diacylglycerol lipase alpha [Melipona quadrifasciata]